MVEECECCIKSTIDSISILISSPHINSIFWFFTSVFHHLPKKSLTFSHFSLSFLTFFLWFSSPFHLESQEKLHWSFISKLQIWSETKTSAFISITHSFSTRNTSFRGFQPRFKKEEEVSSQGYLNPRICLLLKLLLLRFQVFRYRHLLLYLFLQNVALLASTVLDLTFRK